MSADLGGKVGELGAGEGAGHADAAEGQVQAPHADRVEAEVTDSFLALSDVIDKERRGEGEQPVTARIPGRQPGRSSG
ncbi:hypothetical protein [Streptomyces sp. SYSU K217416]